MSICGQPTSAPRADTKAEATNPLFQLTYKIDMGISERRRSYTSKGNNFAFGSLLQDMCRKQNLRQNLRQVQDEWFLVTS